MATIATFKIPAVSNEPNKHYEKDSRDRKELQAALETLRKRAPLEVPLVIGGRDVSPSASATSQPNPSAHAESIARCSSASAADISTAIEAALMAKPMWESLPFADRAAIFLKAADLISGKYRFEIMAATMLGQGKNAWQAEIDAAAELVDFLRFNVSYAQELYGQQPAHNSRGVWNRLEYRALEGFVYAVSPFNFTAIGGNLPCAPALMGNVVIWKPSPSAVASNYLLYSVLKEAGLPPNVIQFVPGDAETITKAALSDRNFAALHFTGSTKVFRSLYGQVAKGVEEGRYRVGYPRVVGETGGKNFHLIHRSADLRNAAVHTVRGAFEFQGQKCSATSRVYVPKSRYEELREILVGETEKLSVGPPQDFNNFIGPVVHRSSFEKLKKVQEDAKNDSSLELLVGGRCDDSKGFYVHPTIYHVKDPHHELLKTELFGPILALYVYDDAPQDGDGGASAFQAVCELIDGTSEYGLTGAVFSRDREAIRYAEDKLRNAAGNFYINCKCTGAVVGQQPFGGARASGTNDKAGFMSLLSRFISMRAIKEEFISTESVLYQSNEV